MAVVEVKVPDIGDFKDVEVIELLVKPGDTIKPEQSATRASAASSPCPQRRPRLPQPLSPHRLPVRSTSPSPTSATSPTSR